MRWLRRSLDWGLCPQTPGIYRFFLARMAVSGFDGDRTFRLSPAFPAAEPVARVASQHCPIPSGSGRLIINHAVGRLKQKPANGEYPLNFVSHLRGSVHLISICVDAGEPGSISEESGRGAVSGVSAQAGGFRGQPAAIGNQQGGRHDAAAATGRERSLYSGAVWTGHRLTAIWAKTVRARREECEEACGGSGGAEIGGTVASAVDQRRSL